MKKMVSLTLFSALASFTCAAPAGESFRPPMDLDKNGEVTEAEYLSFWDARFKKTDKNGDKQLDESEFPVKNFSAWDEGKDGKVSLEEYRAVRTRHFKATDKNGDGVLS